MVDKIVPIVTPFLNNEVSSEKLEHHAKALIEDGMDNIFLCGSTGLGPSLKYEDRRLCLESLKGMSERLIFQVGGLDLSETIKLAELGKKYQVKAISAYPPYYFPRIPTEWLVRYFVTISKVYPLLLYNFPLTTGYDITPEIAKKVIDSGGNVIGVKDTVTDMSHMLSFKWEFGRDFLVYVGPDPLILSALKSNLDGFVAGSANYATELAVYLAKEIESDKGLEAQKLISELAAISRKYGQWSANYAMSSFMRNYDVGDPRSPIFPLAGNELDNMKKDIVDSLRNTKKELSSLFKRFEISQVKKIS